jgi:hypothetical protein
MTAARQDAYADVVAAIRSHANDLGELLIAWSTRVELERPCSSLRLRRGGHHAPESVSATGRLASKIRRADADLLRGRQG